MRTPEHRKRANDDFRRLSPGAFTVLPIDDELPPDPPMAPHPYRLTPTSKRHKNLSFAIIAEPTSQPGSRSPSPSSGRVSPFRGRGFNPAGSRHASPSPPPDDSKTTGYNSKIPTRRGSSGVFGERVSDLQTSPNKRKLNQQLSQSLTNIAPGKVAKKPPPSPRRVQSKAPAFRRLSPIVGSSPEPSQSQSSPNRITGSKSLSRLNSPPRQQTRRSTSKPQSRNVSRDTSPVKIPVSPTKIPVRNSYRNVQAKVNSFSKPKVPPKPQVLNGQNDKKIERKDSIQIRTSMKTNSKSNNTNGHTKSNIQSKTDNKTKSDNKSTKNAKIDNKNIKSTNNNNNNDNTSNINNNTKNSSNSVNKDNNNVTTSNGNDNEIPNGKTDKSSDKNYSNSNEDIKETAKQSKPSAVLKKTDSALKLPSTTTVITNTTATVTQPLKIEATPKPDSVIAPMVDGRVLSATSVSNAMNKMNNTVLDSQTLMKDQGVLKMTPATPNNTAEKTVVTAEKTVLPPVEETMPDTNHTGFVSAKVLEEHVQSNMSKLISPDSRAIANSVQKTVNETVNDVKAEVKPIKITVKEKSADVELQSGNVTNTNGLNETPGLSSQPSGNEPNNQTQDAPKPNICSRIFSPCCKCCKKDETPPKIPENNDDQVKTSCFSCRRKKPDVTISIENEDEPKRKFLDRICCRKNKITDTIPAGQRKESWQERKDSVLSIGTLPPMKKPMKTRCRDFFRKIFCLNLCCRKKATPEPTSRRASIIDGKKKSLTPSTDSEDNVSKLDMSLVEHTSQMRGAIPVLPVRLAWFCLIMNCIAPGTGTIFSGLFCLCLGKPRFSQNDGPRQRIGAFLIDLIIGFGQFFTVLFCLVGWGWSIWWGVIMLKIAKKHQKIRQLQANSQEPPARSNENHRSRDHRRNP